MDWNERWQSNRIGFHQGRPNDFLLRHHAHIEPHRTVLVPLCGKAEDLAYLAAQGHTVVGVELVESAVQAFFAEHALTPEVTTVGPFTRYFAKGISIFCGDFFAATRELIGPVDALYDRAANIALPPAMRPAYVEHVRALLPRKSPGLLITLEYQQDKREGPPFSVPEAEVREAYRGAEVQLLESVPDPDERFASIGGLERCYALML